MWYNYKSDTSVLFINVYWVYKYPMDTLIYALNEFKYHKSLQNMLIKLII